MFSIDDMLRMTQAYRAGHYDPRPTLFEEDVSFDALGEYIEFISPEPDPETLLIAAEEEAQFDINSYL